MKSVWALRAVYFFSAVLGVAASYFLGYLHGYVGSGGSNALMEGSSDVAILSAIRGGQEQAAIRSLEIRLDSNLILHSIYAEDRLALAHLWGSPDIDRKFIARIAQYRNKYPSPSNDPYVTAAISSVLNSAQRSEARR